MDKMFIQKDKEYQKYDVYQNLQNDELIQQGQKLPDQPQTIRFSNWKHQQQYLQFFNDLDLSQLFTFKGSQNYNHPNITLKQILFNQQLHQRVIKQLRSKLGTPKVKQNAPFQIQSIRKKQFRSNIIDFNIRCTTINQKSQYQHNLLSVVYGGIGFKLRIIDQIQDQSFNHQSRILGFGTYGNVINCTTKVPIQLCKCYSFNKHFQIKTVTKCQSFNSQTFQSLHIRFIKEVCLSLLMSAIQCAPKFIEKNGFHFYVFQKCLEFELEQCTFVNSANFQKQLKMSLLKMHLINIVHGDIKPANIMYSKFFAKNVFIDFGNAKFIVEQIGQKTLTNFQGTYRFCSQEMQSLFTKGTKQKIDLYYNDVVMLKKSLQQLKPRKIQYQTERLENINKLCNHFRRKFQINSNILESVCLMKNFICSIQSQSKNFRAFQSLMSIVEVLKYIGKLYLDKSLQENENFKFFEYFSSSQKEFLKQYILGRPELKSLLVYCDFLNVSKMQNSKSLQKSQQNTYFKDYYEKYIADMNENNSRRKINEIYGKNILHSDNISHQNNNNKRNVQNQTINSLKTQGVDSNTKNQPNKIQNPALFLDSNSQNTIEQFIYLVNYLKQIRSILGVFLYFFSFWKCYFKRVSNQQKEQMAEKAKHRIFQIECFKQFNSFYFTEISPSQPFYAQKYKNIIWLYSFMLEYCSRSYQSERVQIFKARYYTLILKDTIILNFRYHKYLKQGLKNCFTRLLHIQSLSFVSTIIIESIQLSILTCEHYYLSEGQKVYPQNKQVRYFMKQIFLSLENQERKIDRNQNKYQINSLIPQLQKLQIIKNYLQQIFKILFSSSKVQMTIFTQFRSQKIIFQQIKQQIYQKLSTGDSTKQDNDIQSRILYFFQIFGSKQYESAIQNFYLVQKLYRFSQQNYAINILEYWLIRNVNVFKDSLQSIGCFHQHSQLSEKEILYVFDEKIDCVEMSNMFFNTLRLKVANKDEDKQTIKNIQFLVNNQVKDNYLNYQIYSSLMRDSTLFSSVLKSHKDKSQTQNKQIKPLIQTNKNLQQNQQKMIYQKTLGLVRNHFQIIKLFMKQNKTGQVFNLISHIVPVFQNCLTKYYQQIVIQQFIKITIKYIDEIVNENIKNNVNDLFTQICFEQNKYQMIKFMNKIKYQFSINTSLLSKYPNLQMQQQQKLKVLQILKQITTKQYFSFNIYFKKVNFQFIPSNSLISQSTQFIINAYSDHLLNLKDPEVTLAYWKNIKLKISIEDNQRLLINFQKLFQILIQTKQYKQLLELMLFYCALLYDSIKTKRKQNLQQLLIISIYIRNISSGLTMDKDFERIFIKFQAKINKYVKSKEYLFPIYLFVLNISQIGKFKKKVKQNKTKKHHSIAQQYTFVQRLIKMYKMIQKYPEYYYHTQKYLLSKRQDILKVLLISYKYLKDKGTIYDNSRKSMMLLIKIIKNSFFNNLMYMKELYTELNSYLNITNQILQSDATYKSTKYKILCSLSKKRHRIFQVNEVNELLFAKDKIQADILKEKLAITAWQFQKFKQKAKHYLRHSKYKYWRDELMKLLIDLVNKDEFWLQVIDQYFDRKPGNKIHYQNSEQSDQQNNFDITFTQSLKIQNYFPQLQRQMIIIADKLSTGQEIQIYEKLKQISLHILSNQNNNLINLISLKFQTLKKPKLQSSQRYFQRQYMQQQIITYNKIQMNEIRIRNQLQQKFYENLFMKRFNY